MTLILTAMNERCAIQISDRRLTSGGKLIDDESNKAIYLGTPDAQLTVAFTGLARVGAFNTRDWLLDAFQTASLIDASASGIVERVANLATSAFEKISAVRLTKPQDKRLDIVFAGYHGAKMGPPGIIYAKVSNLRPDGTIGAFIAEWHTERRPNDKPPAWLSVSGYDVAVTQADLDPIMAAIRKLVSPDDLLSLLHRAMVAIADRPASAGMIGKQLDSIILKRGEASAVSVYDSAVVKAQAHMPAAALISGPSQIMLLKDATIRTDGGAVVVPRVHRNSPCPCGSGKRYRECHRARLSA